MAQCNAWGLVFRERQTLGTFSMLVWMEGIHWPEGSEFSYGAGRVGCGYLNSQEDVDLCLQLLEMVRRERCVSTPTRTVRGA